MWGVPVIKPLKLKVLFCVTIMGGGALFSNLLTSVKLKKSPMPPTNLSTIPEYSSIIGAHG